jgi:predicted Zn finger-like uncharacterized protein
MALATKCPHCNTIFRVAADQLKLRGGIVRCGSCQLVFDGNAALVEPAAKPTPVIPDVAAEAPPPKPAISDYVHGSPVDFEIDFSEEPAAASQPPVAPPAAAAPAAGAPSPAVWRNASAPAAAEPAPAAAQPQAKAPSPDDIAIAAVARAFAHATTPAAPASPAGAPPTSVPQPPAAAPSSTAKPATVPVTATVRAPTSRASRSLIDVVSPDDAFTAAAEPSPPLVPDAPAEETSLQARSPAGPSSLLDLVAPDDIFSATAEPSQPLAPQAAKAPVAATPALRTTFTPAPAPIPAAAPVAATAEAVPVVAATEPETESSSAAVESAPLAEELPSVDHAASPAVEAPPHQDEPSAAPIQAAEESDLPLENAPAFDAPSPLPDAESPADLEAPPQQEELPVEPSQADVATDTRSPVEQMEAPAEPGLAAGEGAPPSEDAVAFEAASPADFTDLAEPEHSTEEHPQPSGDALEFDEPSHDANPEAVGDVEAPQPQDDESPEPGPAIDVGTPADSGEQAGASLVDAIDQWSADNTHPDGRVEPSLDTPGEHLVVAALDDAHHFEDLPSDEQPVAESPAADAEAEIPGEPSLDAEPWSSADATASTLSPAGEPWRLSDPDETALHAVAAVNTDAPDDGASVIDDEPAEPPAKSRRERALKRAKLRRDASGPAAEHDVFAIEENGSDQTISDEEAAARMRAISGVDESAAEEDLDHSDLSFVKRVERSQKYGKAVSVTMAVGVPILLAGLVLQAATTFRDTLAANYPQLKPALAAVCQPLGCKIALPTQLDALSVEPGELASMTENTFSFSTVVRNQSRTPQAWPHIELTLNDNADKPVLRRVFAPSEYLPSPTEAEKGFGPRSEQSIKLYFELKELKASGYHIAIFYP